MKIFIIPEQCPPLNDPANGLLKVDVIKENFLARYECNVGFTISPKESSTRSCNTKARHLDKGVSYGRNEWTGTSPRCIGKNIIMICKRNILFVSMIYCVSFLHLRDNRLYH